VSRSIPTLALLALTTLAIGSAIGGGTTRAADSEPGQPFPRTQLARFAARVARRDGLERRAVLKVLLHARAQPQIIDDMSRPA
jgi:hypothetical protein